MLPLVGIAALMVLGFVIFITALTYDARPKTDRPRDRAMDLDRRRPQRKQLRRNAKQASSAERGAVGVVAGTLRTRAIGLAHESWPRLRHRALDRQGRWLSLESTVGQLIATFAACVVMACLIAMSQ